MKHFAYDSIDELSKLIPAIWAEIKDYNIVLLSGDLGSGKTTLIQQLAMYLQFVDEVSSPTYTLINEYIDRKEKKFYHMDMYRLKSIEEAIDLGLEEIIYSDDVCFIEWPEIIKDILPPKFVHLNITYNTDKRDLEIEKHG